MKLVRSSILLFLAIPVTGLAATAPAYAQKLGTKYHSDEGNGFRFKPLKEFNGIPIPPTQAGSGLIARMDGPSMNIKLAGGGRRSKSTDLWVYALGEPPAEKALEGRSGAARKRTDVLKRIVGRVKGFKAVAQDPVLDEEVKVKKLVARHRAFRADAGLFETYIDIWTFSLDHADISLVYVFAAEGEKRWLPMIAKSAKTFQLIDRVVAAGPGATGVLSYEDQLAAASANASLTEGWRALPTPSKKYIILTSSDNKRFITEVTKRLEMSREIYERDFPPSKEIDQVSIVRICGSKAEFQAYGNTSAGVAGWFNPGSTELVLYDAVLIDRNMSYAVMSHEAFHQYCHFLFDQSEAHRWFDEGHGDYYGGAEFKGSRAVITARMPAGLNRLSVIREMVRDGTYESIEAHINFNHREWQNQGPIAVSCYAQSWSIIYFLRRGTLGKVNRRVWKKGYADIIPNYVTTLHAGYQAARDAVREQRRKVAEEEGRELTAEENQINRFDLTGQKEEIWAKAMQASWGQIDLVEFEANWRKYIEDYLK